MVRRCCEFSHSAFGSIGIGFAEIHHRVASIHAFQAEGIRQFDKGHLLAIVFWRPAEQAQKIDVPERKKSIVAIRDDTHHRSMLALRELRAIRRNQQRQMSEPRNGRARRLKDQNVLERIRKMILAANDMRDL